MSELKKKVAASVARKTWQHARERLKAVRDALLPDPPETAEDLRRAADDKRLEKLRKRRAKK